MVVAEHMAHLVHDGCQQVDPIVGRGALPSDQLIAAGQVGKLLIFGRCLIDEPAVAGGIAVDKDRLAYLFPQYAAGQIGDLDGDAAKRRQDLSADGRRKPALPSATIGAIRSVVSEPPRLVEVPLH